MALILLTDTICASGPSIRAYKGYDTGLKIVLALEKRHTSQRGKKKTEKRQNNKLTRAKMTFTICRYLFD